MERRNIMIGINTNIGSLNAQRNLLQSSLGINEAMTRLSTGLRINSAKDDSAGLAISNRMTAQINGLNQAVRNANDGISLAQTAEGALDETTQMLQEMRKLAVQSSNGTLSQSDRESLNAKYQEFAAEINRISENTTFNGIKLLDGTFDAQIQVGADANQTVGISIGQADLATIMEVDPVGTVTETPVEGMADVAINAAHASDVDAARTIDFTGVEVVEGATYSITVGADEFSYTALAGDDLDTIVSELATAVDGGSYTAAVDGTNSAQINLSAGAGTAEIAVEGTYEVTSTGTGDILTSNNAQSQIDNIDTAIGNVDIIRGNLGAKQNRFESTIANLNNIAENMSAARSRIVDADIAQETSNMMKFSILQQAGVSILAQANQMPSLALSLLR